MALAGDAGMDSISCPGAEPVHGSDLSRGGVLRHFLDAPIPELHRKQAVGGDDLWPQVSLVRESNRRRPRSSFHPRPEPPSSC